MPEGDNRKLSNSHIVRSSNSDCNHDLKHLSVNAQDTRLQLKPIFEPLDLPFLFSSFAGNLT